MQTDNLNLPSKILIIDDKPEDIKSLAILLRHQGYQVTVISNGQAGIIESQTNPPDLILLDIFLPEINGYQICQALKSNEKTKDIPVIFISVLETTLDKVKAFSVGGIDYITKPFQVEEVIARVKSQLTLYAAKREIKRLNLELETRLNSQNQELQIAQEKLFFMAFHDPLTKLPNRTFFLNKLNEEIQRSQNNPNYEFAVLFLDGDRFKIINDSLGHMIGDKLLIEVAKRLQSCISPEATLARLGGDEFTILIENITNISTAEILAQRIHHTISQPFHLGDNQLFINFSIGICLGNSYTNPEEVVRNADIAMYKAKALGKGLYKVFDSTMYAQTLALLKLETQLRQAILQESLQVYYQPIFNLKTNEIISFEALVRWIHPEHGFIPPVDFIPLAEDTGLIVPLGILVLRKACQQLKTWQEQNFVNDEITMSVNLSAKQFSQPDLINQIDRILEITNLDSKYLKLEITESAIMDNPENTTVLLKELRQRNMELSIDDFGTGYSSLSYLHRFPVSTLKIDRSFVNELETDQEKRQIVNAIITLAHALNINIVAEGIETIEQQDILTELGCQSGQGYLFSRPLSHDQMELFVGRK